MGKRGGADHREHGCELQVGEEGPGPVPRFRGRESQEKRCSQEQDSMNLHQGVWVVRQLRGGGGSRKLSRATTLTTGHCPESASADPRIRLGPIHGFQNLLGLRWINTCEGGLKIDSPPFDVQRARPHSTLSSVADHFISQYTEHNKLLDGSVQIIAVHVADAGKTGGWLMVGFDGTRRSLKQ